MNKRYHKNFYQNMGTLHKNSIFLMLSSLSMSGLGFIFWIVAAKLYLKEDLGIASSIISSVAFLTLLSRLGLDQSIIRFFPEGKRNSIFTTVVIVTTIFTLILGGIFLELVSFLSGNFQVIRSHALLYLIFLTSNSIIAIISISFISLRKTGYNFAQSIVGFSRIIFLFPLQMLGWFGIFCSVGISFVIALFISAFLLNKLSIKPIGWDLEFLKESFCFSIGNYFSGLLMTAPSLILPIMVLNFLGAEKAANYYIAFAIASLLFIIPDAFSTSLFVEGSYGESLKKNTMKSLSSTLALLLPAFLFIFIFGSNLLGLFGESYVESIGLLQAMAFSSLFVAIFSIYISIKKIHKETRCLISVSACLFIMLIGLSYIFMETFGIEGIGYAWIGSYSIICIFIGIDFWKNYWVNSQSRIKTERS